MLVSEPSALKLSAVQPRKETKMVKRCKKSNRTSFVPKKNWNQPPVGTRLLWIYKDEMGLVEIVDRKRDKSYRGVGCVFMALTGKECGLITHSLDAMLALVSRDKDSEVIPKQAVLREEGNLVRYDNGDYATYPAEDILCAKRRGAANRKFFIYSLGNGKESREVELMFANKDFPPYHTEIVSVLVDKKRGRVLSCLKCNSPCPQLVNSFGIPDDLVSWRDYCVKGISPAQMEFSFMDNKNVLSGTFTASSTDFPVKDDIDMGMEELRENTKDILKEVADVDVREQGNVDELFDEDVSEQSVVEMKGILRELVEREIRSICTRIMSLPPSVELLEKLTKISKDYL